MIYCIIEIQSTILKKEVKKKTTSLVLKKSYDYFLKPYDFHLHLTK